MIIGPFAWLLAFLVVGWLVDKSSAVQIGLLIALGSLLAGLLALLALRGPGS